MRDETPTLTALSAHGVRYRGKVAALAEHFSEFELIRQRVRVEVAWLVARADEAGIPELPPFDAAARYARAQVVARFAPADAARVKAVHSSHKLDSKAVEYWMKTRLDGHTGV